MGIFKSIRTWFSGKGPTVETSSAVTVAPGDPTTVTQIPIVTHEAHVAFSPQPIGSFPSQYFPVSSVPDVVNTSEVVEEKKVTRPRRYTRSRARATRKHSK